MKIEVGKKYRSRNGKVGEVIRYRGDGRFFPFEVRYSDGFSDVARPNGTVGLTPAPSNYDLVAEEVPALYVVTAAKTYGSREEAEEVALKYAADGKQVMHVARLVASTRYTPPVLPQATVELVPVE